MVKVGCMDGELHCCIVMCHRLEESRIAIKTFWPISDLTFQTLKARAMEADAWRIKRPAEQ